MRRVVTYTYNVSEVTALDNATLTRACLDQSSHDALTLYAIKEDGEIVAVFVDGQAFVAVKGSK